MTKVQMKCLACGRPITEKTGTPAGYCNDCVEKTNKLLSVLDKMIPYEGTKSD